MVTAIWKRINNVFSAFRGHLGRNNSEMLQMRSEILSGNPNTFATDRRNLKRDGQKIVSDLRLSLNHYKLKN